MAISTSKTEIYAEGTTNISWTNLQSNLGAQDPTNIRFGAYKRDISDAEDPLIPDADENAMVMFNYQESFVFLYQITANYRKLSQPNLRKCPRGQA